MPPESNQELAKSLSKLLIEFDRASNKQVISADETLSLPASTLLSNLLAAMQIPLKTVQTSAWNFNPWEVAKLGRDEIRNARVLAWLLNPRGSHGFQEKLLLRLMTRLKENIPNLPNSVGSYCSVRTEQCPNGELSERVDIEIDAESYYLLIELKIDAPEGDEQLSRYGALAESIAGLRPWAIVYITPKGREAKTVGQYANNIIALSWKEMATMIKDALPDEPESATSSWHAVKHAALSFTRHLSTH